MMEETKVDAGALRRLGLTADFDVNETLKPDITRAATHASPRLSFDAIATLPAVDLKDEGSGEAELVPGEVLGKGGMGIVQLAEQRSLKRKVAVKRTHAGSSHAHEALVREATIMGGLEHPNIVPVHALGRTDSREPILVMKRIEGVEWRTVLRDDSHEFWAASHDDPLVVNLDILVAVCNAMHFAHRRGIIHRDLKPANVMLGEFGEVYVLDWGIAMRLGDPPPEEPGSFAGTPAFAAPEMFDERIGLDERTDVFLLGACLHLIWAGKPRHPGTNVLAVMASVLDSNPHDFGTEVPAELGEICNRACAREPAARYQSALELRDAILEYLRHRGSLTLTDAGYRSLARLEAVLEDEPSVPAKSVPGVADERRLDALKIFGECRFAFEQALREWEENARAARGLQSCLEAMIRFEVRQKNHANAAALLADLREPEPELSKRVDQLRVDLERDRSERERLEALDRDLDLTVSDQPRSAALMFVVLSLVLFAPTALVLYLLGYRQIDTELAMIASYVITAGLAVGLVIKRDVLLGNRANRQVGGLLLLYGAGLCANRTAGFLYDRDIAEVLVNDALHGAIMSAVAALMFNKLFIVPTAIMLIAGFTATQAGRAGPVIVLLAAFASIAFMILVTGVWRLVFRKPSS